MTTSSSNSNAAKNLVAKLVAEASALDPRAFAMPVPLHVLLGEAVDVARFVEHYWKREAGGKNGAVARPGLEDAGGKHLARSIGTEILQLQALVQQAQTAYLLAVPPPDDQVVQRASFVVDELSAALEWVFDDGVDDERAAKLQAVVDAHRDEPDSEDALASELADYGALAAEYADELGEVGGFDHDLIAEAPKLVAALRERSAGRIAGHADEGARQLERRNRLTMLLMAKISRVRAAARYVFREHDDIVRQVTSAYERRRRSAARRRAAANAGSTPTTATDTTTTDPAATPS
ncbi:MAG: hypothetical protein IPN32_13145 [Deltaproteobacteria bacterium]|nr:hypothetical protein [Deltaproteobacteria bacterium]